jgi:hypothetical protein
MQVYMLQTSRLTILQMQYTALNNYFHFPSQILLRHIISILLVSLFILWAFTENTVTLLVLFLVSLPPPAPRPTYEIAPFLQVSLPQNPSISSPCSIYKCIPFFPFGPMQPSPNPSLCRAVGSIYLKLTYKFFKRIFQVQQGPSSTKYISLLGRVGEEEEGG